MSLVKWSPFFEPMEGFGKMFEEMNSLVPRMSSAIIPPVDMYETDTSVVVETPLAGVDPNKIDISIENGILSLKGSSERKTEVDEKDFYRQEVRRGSIFRRVTLPTAVEGDKAKASFENGVLKIEIPKSGKIKTVKVAIQKK